MRKHLLLLFILATVFVVGVMVNRTKKGQEASEGLAQTFPEEINVQDVVVEGEDQAPEGFPHLPVYPGSQLLSNTKEGTTYLGEWQVNQKLPYVVAWYMARIYDMGFFMTQLPLDPTSENIQSFTATLESKSVSITATANGDNTAVTVVATGF